MPRTTLANIGSEEQHVIELYLVTLVSSDTLYLTSHDWDIPSHGSLGGVIWTAVPITRDEVKYGADLKVDALKVTMPNLAVTFGNSEATLSKLAMRGLLDNATVLIYQADHSRPDLGRSYHSDWIVQGAQAVRDSVEFELESPLARLMVLTPKRTWQEQCNWGLFSTWCTLVKSNWTVYGQVIGSGNTGPTTAGHVEFTISSRGSLVPATIPGSWFELGEVELTSGALNGLRRSIRVQSLQIPSGSLGVVETVFDFPFAPASGDTIRVVPGCGKTLIADCNSKFNNTVNYGGFPYIPRPETPIGI